MTQISSHAPGMPCWIDTGVATSEIRNKLMNFYSTLFGWKFEVGGPETGWYSIAFLNNKPVLGIGEQSDGEGRWITYFSSSDIEAAAKRVRDAGGEIVMGPYKVLDLGIMAHAIDVTGARHGLWQPITFPGFGVIDAPNTVGWFDHVSEDQAKAAHYYQAVLSNGIVLHAEGDMLVLMKDEHWFASVSQGDASETAPQ